MKWSAIQTLLEEDPSDVLILLDCCASGTANACEGAGVNELISACAWNETANGVGPYSFTSALVIELRRLSQKPSFSVGELYRNIFWRTQSRMPEDIRQEGRERERHPAPIHLVLTPDATPRSIQLSVRQERSRIAIGSSEIQKNTIDTQMDSALQKSDSFLDTATKSPHTAEDDNSTKLSCQQTRQGHIDKNKVPRLAFAIRLHDTFTPGEDLKDLFLQWLRDMPNIAQQVKIEAGFDAFSTLVIVSLPIAFCAYLSRDPAIISLGPILSGNRVSVGTSSLVVNQPSESLSNIPSATSNTVNAYVNPQFSPQSLESSPVVPKVSKSESGKGKMPEIYVENSSATDTPSRKLNLPGSQTNVHETAPQFTGLTMAPAPTVQATHSKYATVSVLLLSWEADYYNDTMEQSQISRMKLKLEEIFTQFYGFQVQQWAIPGFDSHNQLTRKISIMPNTGSNLNIIYYVGHSEGTPGGVMLRRYSDYTHSHCF